DQERHVVIHDLDDRVRRLPAMLLDRWIEGPDASVRRIAAAGEIPVRERGAVQIGGSAFGEIFGIDLTVVTLDEGSDGVALRGRNLRLYQLEHLLEMLCPAEFGGYCHGDLHAEIMRLRRHDRRSYFGAGRGNRTPTLLPELDFESSASTNSAIPAGRLHRIRPDRPKATRNARAALPARGEAGIIAERARPFKPRTSLNAPHDDNPQAL